MIVRRGRKLGAFVKYEMDRASLIIATSLFRCTEELEVARLE